MVADDPRPLDGTAIERPWVVPHRPHSRLEAASRRAYAGWPTAVRRGQRRAADVRLAGPHSDIAPGRPPRRPGRPNGGTLPCVTVRDLLDTRISEIDSAVAEPTAGGTQPRRAAHGRCAAQAVTPGRSRPETARWRTSDRVEGTLFVLQRSCRRLRGGWFDGVDKASAAASMSTSTWTLRNCSRVSSSWSVKPPSLRRIASARN